MITSKQGDCVFGSVCLFVSSILKNYQRIAMKFYGGIQGGK